MKKSILAAAFATVLLVPVSAAAQSAARSLTIEVDAVVKSVDAETREIVLENTETGMSEIIVAGPEVVNFEQIDVGDTVAAVYTLGIAARMALPDEVDTLVGVDAKAAKGETPGALSGTAVTLVLEFIAFDTEKSVATVKDSTGAEQMIDVASDTGRAFVADLKTGDMVALTFTEGLAVGIVEK